MIVARSAPRSIFLSWEKRQIDRQGFKKETKPDRFRIPQGQRRLAFPKSKEHMAPLGRWMLCDINDIVTLIQFACQGIA